MGLTTTLVHEKKHEGQHRGKNDRRASQDIKVVRGHEKHEKHDGRDLPRGNTEAKNDVGGSLLTQLRTDGASLGGRHAIGPSREAEAPVFLRDR